MGAIDIASSILSRSEQRVEISAQNIANMTTSGYKARHSFSNMLPEKIDPELPSVNAEMLKTSSDFTAGKLQKTGNVFDLAISGPGFFNVRSGEVILFTRNGQFHRDSDGHLVTNGGMVLQGNNGDLVLSSEKAAFLGDGTVLDDGQPVARLTVSDCARPELLEPVGAELFSAPPSVMEDAPSAQVHQGMLEASNVSTANEMVAVMSAVRSAESAQRIVQIYDDLMGRALTAFGQR